MCDLTIAEKLVIYLETQNDVGEWWAEHVPHGLVLDDSNNPNHVILTGIHGDLIDDIRMYFPAWKLRPHGDIPPYMLRDNVVDCSEFLEDEYIASYCSSCG